MNDAALVLPQEKSVLMYGHSSSHAELFVLVNDGVSTVIRKRLMIMLTAILRFHPR